MRTGIEQMGLDLYNALRGPLSQMKTTKEMDNFKVDKMISGMNANIIAECMKCAQINIESGENMKRAGIHMNWEMIDYYNNLIIKACENAIKEENTTAQVNIIEIEVEGIRYTQTRPGYYYKKVDGKQTRIPKSEWEQAFDEYTQTAQDNADADGWDVEQEVEARKEAEEQKDRETEQNFNGKAKKVAKPRRSKDVAFEMDTLAGHITLTAKQVDFIKHLPDTCYWENGLESSLWCDCLADEIGGQFAGKPMTVGAMISTLREKGLIEVQQETARKGKPKYMVLTVIGQVIAEKLGLK